MCNSLKNLNLIIKKKLQNSKNFNLNNIIHYISDLQTLILAYEKIKSKASNAVLLDGLTRNKLINLSVKLKAGKFTFNLNKKVIINNGTKSRELCFPSDFASKITQQALVLVLEIIFSDSFSKNSYSFKGTHLALKNLKQKLNGVVWVFKGDIKNNFGSVNHNTLLKIIKTRISCYKTLALIKNCIQTGYIYNNQIFRKISGLHQGNIVSPILNEIYLSKFDKFIRRINAKITIGLRKKKNPIYRSLQYQISNVKSNKSLKKKLRSKLWNTKSVLNVDPNFVRVHYFRYVDDFILIFISSLKLVKTVVYKIKKFLAKLNLYLNCEKTDILNFNKNSFEFLSVIFKTNNSKIKKIAKYKFNRKKRVTAEIRLLAPLKKILEKLKAAKMLKQINNQYFSTALKFLVNLDHADILRFYNSKFLGLINYYSFVNNFNGFGTIAWYFRNSCALTLALKYKLKTSAKAFKKFKFNLTCFKTNYKLNFPTFFASKQHNFNIKFQDFDLNKLIFQKWVNKLTNSNINKFCIICNSTQDIEMHHIKSIKTIRSKIKEKKGNLFNLQLQALNRKQVPVCKAHHIKIHNNTLSTSDLSKFNANINKE
jgi:retron-type reverse transcriptase